MKYVVTLQGPTGAQITVTVQADTEEKACTAALRRIARTAAYATRHGWLALHVVPFSPVL